MKFLTPLPPSFINVAICDCGCAVAVVPELGDWKATGQAIAALLRQGYVVRRLPAEYKVTIGECRCEAKAEKLEQLRMF